MSKPSIKVLENEMNDLEEKLSQLLSTTVSNIYVKEELISLSSECKSIYKEYCNVNFKLVGAKSDAGALAEADELRNNRLEFKKEMKELIKLINNALGNSYADISFNSSTVSLETDTLTKDNEIGYMCDISPNNSLRTPMNSDQFITRRVTFESPLPQQAAAINNLKISESNELAADNPRFITSSPSFHNVSNYSNPFPSHSTHKYPTNENQIINPARSFKPIVSAATLLSGIECKPMVTSASGYFDPITSSSSYNRYANESQYSFPARTVAPAVSSDTLMRGFDPYAVAPPINSTVGSRSYNYKDTMQYSNDKYFPVASNIDTNNPINKSRGPFSAGRYTTDFSNQPPVYSTGKGQTLQPNFSSNYNYRTSQDSGPNVPPIRTTCSTDSHQAPASTSLTDALANHFLKGQLFQKTGQPFNGEAHKYHAWLKVMERKMSGLSLDPWDVLTVLYENTTGKPRKMIENFMNSGAANPDLTLRNVWNSLHEQFGTGNRIATAIFTMLDSFPIIRSPHNTDKLGDLINICHIIAANMTVAEELQIFNLSLGIRKIWIKLPDTLQNGWRTFSADFYNNHGSSPVLYNLVAYLERKHREFCDKSYEKTQVSSAQEYHGQPRKVTLKTETPEEEDKTSTTESANCLLHPNGKHSLNECNLFIKKPYEEKKTFILENKLCFTCLGPHFKQDCPGKVTCRFCKGNHASGIHRDMPYKPKDEGRPSHANFETSSNLCTKVCGGDVAKSCSKVLLVDITYPSGSSKSLRCYAILDEQSSSSFVDPRVVDYFSLEPPERKYIIKTLTGLETTVSGMEVQGLKVKGINQKKIIHMPTVMTNEFIPNCKGEVATPDIVTQHKHIAHLAHNFTPLDELSDVLILLGRDCGAAMATQCFGYRAPYAHRTPLGWALVGNSCLSHGPSEINTVLKVQSVRSMFEHVSAVEIFPKKELVREVLADPFAEAPDDELPGPSKEDIQFMHKVISSIQVNEEGNITMPLPFKNDGFTFPNNRTPVYHRMVNTLNKMKGDPQKLSKCLESMKNNLDAGHVERVPPDELQPKIPGSVWYIPLFCVTHPKKDKIRLVFDSTASYQNTSLNSQLLQGPDINTHLSTVLLRFRKKPVGFSADIESMFYAFHLEHSDRDYTRFFWWRDNNPSDKMTEYRATRHIFGNKSSPSVANIGLRYAVSSSPLATEQAKNFVYNNFYVDDGCASADTVEEAINILKETRASLSSFNIRLHKIASSSPEVLKSFPSSEIEESIQNKDFNHLESQRTLGVEWNPSTDSFIVRSNVPSKPYTKRGTLATTNSLFDPLGFVAPVVLAGRLLQRFFIPPKNGNPIIARLGWDDPLPEEHHSLWNDWIEALRSYDGKIVIPRSLYPLQFAPISNQTLHVFCDASEDGIGCVAYLRSVNSINEVHVAFVVGSSKVAPRGTSSIPRLELCAALEASIVAYKISADIGIEQDNIHFYSDSRVVLGYLSNTNKRFSRYVTRRISIILKSSSASQWHYVPTEVNPGDIASRPQTFRSLSESAWFRGPAFIWSQVVSQFSQPTSIISLPETVEEVTSLRTDQQPVHHSVLSDTFTRVSSWSKLVNVTKIVINFIVTLSEKCALRRGKQIASRPNASSDQATSLIVRCIQQERFSSFCSGSIPFPKSISSLSPFVEDSILKVGGRLKRANSQTLSKYPIILPATCPATILLVKHYHCKVKHQGRTITSSAIREAGYYIHSGTSVIKKFIRSCVTCRLLRQPCLNQKMSDLPYDRLEQSPPFTYCGMDVFGHYMISEGATTRRNSSLKKCWVIVFICLVSKAVHVEPLPHMDTSTFKLALRRFFCLRGVCKKLRSDRGTNFIGARNQEHFNLDIDSIHKEVTDNECEWELNPPHASHFGGLWERSIGSFRKVLSASFLTLGKRPPTRDEFNTFLQEAASIINNTPLYEISNDPNDELPLTPAKLMTLKDVPNPPPLDSFSERDLLAYGSRRWRRVQAISDDFWRRWKTEYMEQLHKRQKWIKEIPNISIGDIVLMRIKNTKRNFWPLARVKDIKVSEDKLVRSVTLSIPASHGSTLKHLERPITEVVPILQRSEGYTFE